MSGRLLKIIVFLCFLPYPVFSQTEKTDELLKEIIRKEGQVRVSVPFTSRQELIELSREASVSSVRDKKAEVVLSARTLDWFLMKKFSYSVIQRAENKGLITAADISEAMAWDKYPTYTQYDSIMKSFQTKYPALCNLDTIGTSVNGKLVLALKISDNVQTDEDEPEVFYTSSIHGDETGGFILMMRLSEYLLKNYTKSSRIKNLVDNLEIWINPLSNPDGTYRTGNTISFPVRENANGYDLNRNFPDPDYPGSVRQKETLDMMKFLEDHRFVISANFHSGEEVVNYPWDRWSRLHADNDWFHYISRRYADTVHKYAPATYMDGFDNGVTNGADWYTINGGRQDYVTYDLQGREVTIELHDYYETPASLLNALWDYNYRSLIGYLENAMWGIHGDVRNAITGVTVPARIFISGYDTDSSHVYSDTLTGSFVRMLSPGAWDITFSANGYLTKVITDVVVVKDKKTELHVGMWPADSPPAEGLRFAPNPSGETMNVILPERQTGRINIRIFNILGGKIADYYENTYEDVPLTLDLRKYGGGTYIIMITNTLTGITDTGKFVVIRQN